LRIHSFGLLLLCIAVLAVTLAGQTLLAAPVNIAWPMLSDVSRTGGIARLIFFEGHFPLLPWLAVFISGIISGRLLLAGKWQTAAKAGFIIATAGFILMKLYSTGYSFAVYGSLFRLFVFKPTTHYPPFLSQIIFMNGLILLLSSFYYRFKKTGSPDLLSDIGRCSLSLFILHIILFSNIFSLFKLTNSLNPLPSALFSLILTVIIAILISRFIKSYRFFSFEYLMRRITG
jgi:uncharacterized membrane protein